MKSSYMSRSVFNLNRYKDNHGKWYELRPNRLPRGKVYQRLDALEWKKVGLINTDLMAEIVIFKATK